MRTGDLLLFTNRLPSFVKMVSSYTHVGVVVGSSLVELHAKGDGTGEHVMSDIPVAYSLRERLVDVLDNDAMKWEVFWAPLKKPCDFSYYRATHTFQRVKEMNINYRYNYVWYELYCRVLRFLCPRSLQSRSISNAFHCATFSILVLLLLGALPDTCTTRGGCTAVRRTRCCHLGIITRLYR